MYKDNIFELFKNGYLSTKDVVKNGIPRIYLSILVKEGIIERVSRGLYIKKNDVYDEMMI